MPRRPAFRAPPGSGAGPQSPQGWLGLPDPAILEPKNTPYSVQILNCLPRPKPSLRRPPRGGPLRLWPRAPASGSRR